MSDSLREFCCARCGERRQICGRCDRGNIYCGVVCSGRARLASVKATAKRYQQSFVGRMNHAKRQKAYRLRRTNLLPEQKVTHQSSPNLRCNVVLPAPKLMPQHCNFCGGFVGEFIRYWFYKGRGGAEGDFCAQGP